MSTSGSFPRQLADGLGYDTDESRYSAWTQSIWSRDEPAIDRRLEQIRPKLPDSLRRIDLGQIGREFLCFRTHFLRFAAVAEQTAGGIDALVTSLATAAAIDGQAAEIPCSAFPTDRISLLDGTNLVVASPGGSQRDGLVLDGTAGTATLGAVTIHGRLQYDRFFFDDFESEGLVSLPTQGSLAYFYQASESDNDFNDQRRLITRRDQVEDFVALIREVEKKMRDQGCGAAWNVFSKVAIYLNPSTIPYMDSSSDLRESRGSIMLNPRSGLIDSRQELVAWAAQGLYHESKHWQFFDTYRSNRIPGLPAGGTDCLCTAHPRIPCAWKASPSARSMDEHLLALQAFIPGLIVAMRVLSSVPKFSQWLRDRLELEMRSVNGAVGAAILGRRYLTDEGAYLLDVLLADYHTYLLPAFEEVQDRLEE